MDNVLIMSKETVQEWKEITSILTSFCRSSRLIVNHQKSILHFSRIEQEDVDTFKEIFPFKFVELSDGFRYMGYFLKLVKYKVEDW
jgi:hypothetical protein